MIRHILIIRHGSTALNDHQNKSKDKIRGHMDVPLDYKGKLEARKLGDKLKENPPSVLVSSDLCRAKETAFIISQETKIPLALVTSAFRPWDLGKYTGEVAAKCHADINRLVSHPDEKAPSGGGFSGENFNGFRHRLFSGLYGALQHFPGLVGIVTHHRVERLLIAWRAAGYPRDFGIDTKVFLADGEAPGKALVFAIPPADMFKGYGWA